MVRWILMFIVVLAVVVFSCTPVAAQAEQPANNIILVQQPTAQGVLTPAAQVLPYVYGNPVSQAYLMYVPVRSPVYGAGWARPGLFGSIVYRQRVWTGRPWLWRPFVPRYIPGPPIQPMALRPAIVTPGILYRQLSVQ